MFPLTFLSISSYPLFPLILPFPVFPLLSSSVSSTYFLASFFPSSIFSSSNHTFPSLFPHFQLSLIFPLSLFFPFFLFFLPLYLLNFLLALYFPPSLSSSSNTGFPSISPHTIHTLPFLSLFLTSSSFPLSPSILYSTFLALIVPLHFFSPNHVFPHFPFNLLSIFLSPHSSLTSSFSSLFSFIFYFFLALSYILKSSIPIHVSSHFPSTYSYFFSPLTFPYQLFLSYLPLYLLLNIFCFICPSLHFFQSQLCSPFTFPLPSPYPFFPLSLP